MKVREILKLIKDEGWYLITTEGSHRQFKHPTKPGRVTVFWASQRRYTPKDFEERHDPGRVRKEERLDMQYAMIIEKGERNYSAYLPDLPSCIATGKTLEEVKQLMREAVELHLRGMREDGLPIPEPSLVEYVEAA